MGFCFRIIPDLRVNFSGAGASSNAAGRGAWSKSRGIGPAFGSPGELSYIVIERVHNPARAVGLVLLMIVLAALALVVAAQGQELTRPMNPDDKNLGPEMARAYRNYLLTCRRLGVEPVARERSQELMAEWFETLCRAMTPPGPTTRQRKAITRGGVSGNQT